jgi:hypothetical protein
MADNKENPESGAGEAKPLSRWRTAWPPLVDHLGAAGMGGLARI